ncbi:MAG: putative peptidoglycan glycosyltransferase FtsW [Clostridium sp.]|nr:putative peptidoglycan glycosyltransferase FtsW [Clostridium sp.]
MRDERRENQIQEPRKKIRFWNPGEYFDYSLLVIILFLVGFGLVMVYSASSYTAALDYGDSAYFFKRQAIFAVMGAACMLVISKIDYHFLKRLTVPAFIGIGIMVIAVLLVGSASGGSTRWLELGPLRFQPSELAKMAIIMFVAHATTNKVWKLNDWKVMLKIMIPPMILTVLIAIENLSTAIICGVIVMAILFVASPKYWPFVALTAVGAVGGVLFILTAGYRAERIDAWLNVETHPKGYQTLQAMYAIGSGGLWGRGLGQSIQKMDFIPESHNDMIFSVICEELGLVGGVALILLFIILIWRLMLIIVNARDLYGSLLVVGVLAHVAVQVLINVAVVTNTMPNTGVPLPFISYGGTSLVFLLVEMGIVLSVARQIKIRK